MRRGLTVAAVAIVAAFYAFRNGSYDLVVRQLEGITVWGAFAAVALVGLGPRIRLPRTAVLIGVAAAYVGWIALSLAWTESPERTVAEIARATHYLGVVALIWLVVGRRTWTSVAVGLATAALGVSAFAVLTRLFPDALPSAAVAQFIPDRLSYPLEYWNAVACWGAMAATLGVGLSAHGETALGRAFSLVFVPAAVLSIFLAESRGGVIALVAGMIFVIALSRNRWLVLLHIGAAAIGSAIAIGAVHANPAIENATGTAGAGQVIGALALAGTICAAVAVFGFAFRLNEVRLPFNVARGATIAGVVVGLLAVLTVGRGPIGDAWHEFADQRTVDRSGLETLQFNFGGTRKAAFDSAYAAFESRPLAGIGAGAMQLWWTREGRSSENLRDAHSLYLEHMAELGLPGLALLLGILGSLLWLGILARRRARTERRAGTAAATTAAFGVFCVHAGIDWMWEVSAVAVLALACGATAAVGAGSSARNWSDWRPRTIAGVVALIAVLTQVPGLLGTQKLRSAEDALAAGDAATAIERAGDASDWEPWAASPKMIGAAAATRAGRLNTAERDARDAIDSEPQNWRPRILLAKAQAARGDRRGANYQLAQARRLAPKLITVRLEAERIRQRLESSGR